MAVVGHVAPPGVRDRSPRLSALCGAGPRRILGTVTGAPGRATPSARSGWRPTRRRDGPSPPPDPRSIAPPPPARSVRVCPPDPHGPFSPSSRRVRRAYACVPTCTRRPARLPEQLPLAMLAAETAVLQAFERDLGSRPMAVS